MAQKALRGLVDALLDEPGLTLSPRLSAALESAEEELRSEAMTEEEYTRKTFESHVGMTAGADEDCGSCSCTAICRYAGETL